MLRRVVQRARRRIPTRSVGHESPDGDATSSIDRSRECEDIYYVGRRDDDRRGPLGQASPLARLQGQKLTFVAHKHISTVHAEERDAAQAWRRLRQLYSVFQAIEEARALANDEEEDLNVLFESAHVVESAPPAVLRDLASLAEELPQGFTTDMFLALGDALHSEMVAAERNQRFHPEAFETIGDLLYVQAVSVAA